MKEVTMKMKYILDKLIDKFKLTDCEYSDILGTVKKQVEMTKCFSEILKIRQELIET